MTSVFVVGTEPWHSQHGKCGTALPKSARRQFRERRNPVKTHQGGQGEPIRDKEGLGGVEASAARGLERRDKCLWV